MIKLYYDEIVKLFAQVNFLVKRLLLKAGGRFYKDSVVVVYKAIR